MIALAAHRQPTFLPPIEPHSSELMTSGTGQLAALALDYIETAVFVLDANSRIHFASATAKRMLETGRLSARNGLLVSAIGSETKALRLVVKQCVEAASSGPVPMTFAGWVMMQRTRYAWGWSWPASGWGRTNGF